MNKIVISRNNYAPTYTLGFIKHKDFFCFTLEPAKKVIKVDDLKWQMQYPEEVPDLIPVGKGCIPCGLYRIVWEWSPKFKRHLWELKEVPNFTEVKAHVGNVVEDTNACQLLGYRFMCAPNQQPYLSFSTEAVEDFNKLCHAEKITHIEIRDV